MNIREIIKDESLFEIKNIIQNFIDKLNEEKNACSKLDNHSSDRVNKLVNRCKSYIENIDNLLIIEIYNEDKNEDDIFPKKIRSKLWFSPTAEIRCDYFIGYKEDGSERLTPFKGLFDIYTDEDILFEEEAKVYIISLNEKIIFQPKIIEIIFNELKEE